ncbi:DUF6042 family protein [Streptomyces sp. NPDC001744]|uniref:DUF6042 family protein n=1 Tax=Streptomyces sp. NPDC001744 TaxID=3364606 RepID=UPI00369E25A9
MTENPSVPGPRRDMAMHNGWWATGWEHVLPRQGMPLTMLISTAGRYGFTGTPDDLLREVFDGHWKLLGGDLDAPLTFAWPDGEWDHTEAPEGREAFEANHREEFAAVLTTAGFPVPTTVRELSELYLTWGLAHREETPDGPRWSMPEVLPLPEELLPLDAELAGRIGSVRRSMRADPLVGRLVTHLTDDLGGPREVLTSLDRLAAATGQDADDVRLALTELVESGDALVWRGQERADPERLEAHRRFRLVMDWDHYHEARTEPDVEAGV